MTDLLRVPQAAEVVGYTQATITEWCRKGKLPATKHGHHWYIRRQDLEALFDPFASGRSYHRLDRGIEDREDA